LIISSKLLSDCSLVWKLRRDMHLIRSPLLGFVQAAASR